MRVKDEFFEEMELISEYEQMINPTEFARSLLTDGVSKYRRDIRYQSWKRERLKAKSAAEERAESGVVE